MGSEMCIRDSQWCRNMAISVPVRSVPFYEPFHGFPFRSSMHTKSFPVLLFHSTKRVQICSVPCLDIPCRVMKTQRNLRGDHEEVRLTGSFKQFFCGESIYHELSVVRYDTLSTDTERNGYGMERILCVYTKVIRQMSAPRSLEFADLHLVLRATFSFWP